MWFPLSFILISSSVSFAQLEGYFCGVDVVSKWTSLFLSSRCDQQGINQCCLSHDNCYSSCSLPQSACDWEFCSCLSALPSDLFCRNFVIAGHCNLVQWLGHQYICPPMAQPISFIN